MNARLMSHVVAMTFLAVPAWAQDAFDPEAHYGKVCKNCHGPTAAGMASFPKLNDKSAAYLAMRLAQYRAGEQVGSNTALMRPHAAELTDEQLVALSDFIATSFN